MDPLDRRIVHALTIAPRASFRELAGVLGTSDQTVARRYRALQAEIGLRVTARRAEVHPNWNSWLVRIQATPDAAGPLAQALAARNDTAWVRLGSGGTEVICAVQTRSGADKGTFLLTKLTGGQRVVGISAHLLLCPYSPVAWSWLSSALTEAQAAALADFSPGAPTGAPADAPAWTDDDESLVGLLQEDGRTTAAGLAKATGWHESTVRRRIQQLTASGALQFDIDLDEEAIGIQVLAQLWLAVDPGALDATGREIARHAEAPFVAAFTGPANLLVSVACQDANHLYRYITERLGQIPAVRSIESVPINRTYKRQASIRSRVA